MEVSDAFPPWPWACSSHLTWGPQPTFLYSGVHVTSSPSSQHHARGSSWKDSGALGNAGKL